MAFGSGDLSVFFSDMGVSIVFGAYTTKGNYEIATADLEDGTGLVIKGRTRIITYTTATLPGLRKGSTVVVDGVTYEVTWCNPEDDGQISKAYLEIQ